MMMFDLDIDGSSRGMSDLRHVHNSLQRLCDELKQKIGRGEQAKPCHGSMRDESGNEVGEWDFRVFDDAADKG